MRKNTPGKTTFRNLAERKFSTDWRFNPLPLPPVCFRQAGFFMPKQAFCGEKWRSNPLKQKDLP
jgi:hypothetical protein